MLLAWTQQLFLQIQLVSTTSQNTKNGRCGDRLPSQLGDAWETSWVHSRP